MVQTKVLLPNIRFPARGRRGLELAEPVPAFDVPTTLRGRTEHFSVYYETSAGQAGGAIADFVISRCEADNALVGTWFNLPSPSFNVIVLAGFGGAYHYGCHGVDLYCHSMKGDNELTAMLVVAEAVEVYEAVQARGWDCGASPGEGLSRVLATELYPQALDGFESANSWLNSDRPDWVSQAEPTDTNYVSIGCSVLFLNWLRYQLGYAWNNIVQAGGSTLEETYRVLTGKSDGFANFSSLLAKHFPGKQNSLPDDTPSR